MQLTWWGPWQPPDAQSSDDRALSRQVEHQYRVEPEGDARSEGTLGSQEAARDRLAALDIDRGSPPTGTPSFSIDAGQVWDPVPARAQRQGRAAPAPGGRHRPGWTEPRPRWVTEVAGYLPRRFLLKVAFRIQRALDVSPRDPREDNGNRPEAQRRTGWGPTPAQSQEPGALRAAARGTRRETPPPPPGPRAPGPARRRRTG